MHLSILRQTTGDNKISNKKISVTQTHCSNDNMEPFTLTLVFQFFPLEPV